MTLYLWHTATKKEGFNNTDAIIDNVLGSVAESTKVEKPPTSIEAANHYKAILTYISTDFSNGLRLVYDLNKRIYGKVNNVPDDFDPRDVMKNYKNPLMT
jgi:hypothetical protein